MSLHPRLILAGAALAVLAVPSMLAARRWGEAGHRMIGQVAAEKLPAATPAFFRAAAPQLAYLNPEPDRWRTGRDDPALDPAMNEAFAPDHYVDLELLPPNALLARDRHAYADSLRAAGVDAATAGFATYRVLELTDRLREEFALWRRAPNARTRAWIEQRIVNDAGILGHYVADLSNPHHTSIHHHGWKGANPRGYSTESSIHSRFEGAYVQSHVSRDDFDQLVARQPARMVPLRDSVLAYVQRTHGELNRLYDLEKQEPFGIDTRGAAHQRFVEQRLAAGAEMLRDLWWTAWVESGRDAGARNARP